MLHVSQFIYVNLSIEITVNTNVTKPSFQKINGCYLGHSQFRGLMTRNNLREHLTWLLASIPSNPPPRRPPGNNGLTSQSFSSHNNIESLPGSQTVRSGQCPNNGSSGGGEGENYSENPPPSTSQVPVFPSDETMARLQSGPRASKKSCLLSQPMLEPLQTPKAFQPLDSATSVQRDASNDQSASGTRIRLPTI